MRDVALDESVSAATATATAVAVVAVVSTDVVGGDDDDNDDDDDDDMPVGTDSANDWLLSMPTVSITIDVSSSADSDDGISGVANRSTGTKFVPSDGGTAVVMALV